MTTTVTTVVTKKQETASEQSQSETIDMESDSEPDHEQFIQKISLGTLSSLSKLECVCICDG